MPVTGAICARPVTAKGQPAFEIDPGKLAEAARFDGIFVLRSNARMTPLQAGAALSRPGAGRGPVPPCQSGVVHAADLPLLRRSDPRSRVLLVPGTAAAKAPGRSGADRRRYPRMENAIARPRPSAATAHPP